MTNTGECEPDSRSWDKLIQAKLPLPAVNRPNTSCLNTGAPWADGLITGASCSEARDVSSCVSASMRSSTGSSVYDVSSAVDQLFADESHHWAGAAAAREATAGSGPGGSKLRPCVLRALDWGEAGLPADTVDRTPASACNDDALSSGTAGECRKSSTDSQSVRQDADKGCVEAAVAVLTALPLLKVLKRLHLDNLFTWPSLLSPRSPTSPDTPNLATPSPVCHGSLDGTVQDSQGMHAWQCSRRAEICMNWAPGTLGIGGEPLMVPYHDTWFSGSDISRAILRYCIGICGVIRDIE